MTTKQIRMPIDILMTLLSIVLMGGTMLFPNEKVHQILGILLLALWAIHITLNRRWYKAVFRGKYNARRIFQTVVNCGILLCALLLMLSGLSMAWFMPSNFGINASRTIHLVSSHWYYVFMSLHLGLHVEMIVTRIKQKKDSHHPDCDKSDSEVLTLRHDKVRIVLLHIILFLIFAYGMYAFIIRGVWKYMLCLQPFFFLDLGNGGFLGYAKFAFDYISILAHFAIITNWIKNIT